MRIAVSQFDPGSDPAANAGHLVAQAARAAADGAQLLLAPEGSLVSFLQDDITIAAGTFVPDPQSTRVHNTLVVLRGGAVVAAYRKIHLYDAFSFVESDFISPGSDGPPVVEIGGVPVGFATCYDLRFPELFRVLQARGAQVLAIASAWVRGPFKEEHWLTLLRARAIENVSYVVAADQVGRAGIGRSAAFDPFGLPLLDLGISSPGYAVVEVTAERVAEVREVLPSNAHARFVIAGQPGPAGSPPGPPG